MNTPSEVDVASDNPFDDPRDRPEEAARRIRFGILLFIASLAMLFGGSLVGYIIIRFTSTSAPPRGAIVMPGILWVSTALLLCSGVSIQIASRAAHHGLIVTLRRCLLASWVLSYLFVIVQAPGVFKLYMQQRTLEQAFYGLTLTMIVIHAAHIIGGLIPLTVLTMRSLTGLTFSDRIAIQTCAVYWHFLEIVWLVMFGTFLALG